MSIESLFIYMHPLIDILGTICLIALMAGGVLYILVWIGRRIWRYVLTAGAITAFVVILALSLGVL